MIGGEQMANLKILKNILINDYDQQNFVKENSASFFFFFLSQSKVQNPYKLADQNVFISTYVYSNLPSFHSRLKHSMSMRRNY